MIQALRRIAPQFTKFALVGVINTFLHLLIVNFLSILTGVTSGVGVIFIKACAFIIANINSYILNKKWTFHAESKDDAEKFLSFFIISLGGLLINTSVAYTITTFITPFFGIESIMSFLGDKAPILWLNVASIIAIGLSMIWNFIGYKLIVFKK